MTVRWRMCPPNGEISRTVKFWEEMPESGFEHVKKLKCLLVTQAERSVGSWNVLNSAKDTQMHRTQSLPWRSLWSSCEMEPSGGESAPCPTPAISTQEPQKPVSLGKN